VKCNPPTERGKILAGRSNVRVIIKGGHSKIERRGRTMLKIDVIKKAVENDLQSQANRIQVLKKKLISQSQR
jgi:hypothetical protein